MKKVLLFIASFLIVGIVAVFYLSEEKEATIKPIEEEQEQDKQVLQENPSNQETDENHTDQEDSSKITELNEGEDVSRFEEYSKIQTYINIDEYTAEIVEDHPNKRIILFINSERETKYKSIYIKHKNFVKLIQLDGNGLLYKGSV